LPEVRGGVRKLGSDHDLVLVAGRLGVVALDPPAQRLDANSSANPLTIARDEVLPYHEDLTASDRLARYYLAAGARRTHEPRPNSDLRHSRSAAKQERGDVHNGCGDQHDQWPSRPEQHQEHGDDCAQREPYRVVAIPPPKWRKPRIL
jgi:hypothetical protein